MDVKFETKVGVVKVEGETRVKRTWIDKPITNNSEDKLNIQKPVEEFVEDYINSGRNGLIIVNGKWGVGKTSFINCVKEMKKDKKFIDLPLWGANHQNDIYAYTYEKMHKKKVWMSKIFSGICHYLLEISKLIIGLLSVLLVSQFFISKTEIIDFIGFFEWVRIILITIVIIVIFYVVEQIINISFEEDKRKVKVSKSLERQNRFGKARQIIFVIDDLERVYEEYNITSFLNFLLEQPVIVIALCDMSKVEGKSIDFNQKVINSIYNLPSQNRPSNIFKYFQEELNGIIEKNPSDDRYGDEYLLSELQTVFISENTSMRDVKKMMPLIKKKWDKNSDINPGEFIILVYFYVKHHNFYNVLCNQNESLYKSKENIEKFILHDGNIEKDSHEYRSISLLLNSIFKNTYWLKSPSLKNKGNFPKYYILEELGGALNENFFNYSETADIDELQNMIRITDDAEIQNEDYQLFLERLDDKEHSQYFLLKLLVVFSRLSLLPDKKSRDVFESNQWKRYLYSLINKITKSYKIEKNKIFEKFYGIVKNDDKLDLSEILYFLPMYIPMSSDPSNQENMASRLIEEKFKKSIFEYQNPLVILRFFSVYYHESEIYSQREYLVNELFYLTEINFYDFVTKKMVNDIITTEGNRKCIYLESISYSDEFKNKFLDKVCALEEKEKDEILGYIKNENDLF